MKAQKWITIVGLIISSISILIDVVSSKFDEGTYYNTLLIIWMGNNLAAISRIEELEEDRRWLHNEIVEAIRFK